MHKRGDTLIEVMFAVAIFGMAAIGTISLMNKGLASTYPRLLYANTVNPNSTEAENLSDATMTGQQVVYGDNKKSLNQ